MLNRPAAAHAELQARGDLEVKATRRPRNPALHPRDILDRADQLAATAAAERANGQQADKAMRHQEVRRQLQEAKGKSRIALRLAGTSRKETIALADEYAAKESAAYREIVRARRAAEDALREAWSAIRNPETISWSEPPGFRAETPHTVDELQARLAAMCEWLPDVERITDRAVARDAEPAERQAAEFRSQAASYTAAAGKLQEEKALRTRMAAEAPTQHAREVKQRAEYVPRPMPRPTTASPRRTRSY
ncbi:hypothetical protein [Streptomyces sp. NPDC046759]|uniref:hypothetical protein n=1 Tax=Streptomyces sp. NPDC046759 TaxID=3155019 RepID=UPI0033E25CFC